MSEAETFCSFARRSTSCCGSRPTAQYRVPREERTDSGAFTAVALSSMAYSPASLNAHDRCVCACNGSSSEPISPVRIAVSPSRVRFTPRACESHSISTAPKVCVMNAANCAFDESVEVRARTLCTSKRIPASEESAGADSFCPPSSTRKPSQMESREASSTMASSLPPYCSIFSATATDTTPAGRFASTILLSLRCSSSRPFVRAQRA